MGIRVPAGSALVASVVAALIVGACQPSAPPSGSSAPPTTTIAPTTPPTAVKITVVTASEPTTGDFHREVGGGPTLQFAENISEGLVRFDDKYQLQPALAESWTEESPTSWVFHLRKGVKFTDGTPFNADAVKYSFDRTNDPATQSRNVAQISAVSDVKVVDDSTVRLELKQPFAPLLHALAYALRIVSPTAAKAAGVADFGRKPVYTGPFSVSEWVSGDHITLKANKDYWGGAPKIDEITWRFAAESSARLALLRSGGADFLDGIDGTDLAAASSDPSITVNRVLPLSWNFVAMNEKTKPFDDVRVRQAVSYAINGPDLIKTILFGAGEPMTEVVANGVQGFNSSAMTYAYDPAKAKQLLADAGYANGFDTEFGYATGYTAGVKPLTEAIQGQLAAVGIRAKLVVSDNTAWTAARRDGQMPMFFMNWGSPNNDDHTALYQAFHSSQITPTGPNYVFYSDPKVDELLQQASVVEESQRDALYQQAVAQIMAGAPWAMVNQLVTLETYKKNLTNVQHRGWYFYLGNVSVQS